MIEIINLRCYQEIFKKKKHHSANFGIEFFLLKFYNGKWEEIESIRLDSGNPFLMISDKMEENMF